MQPVTCLTHSEGATSGGSGLGSIGSPERQVWVFVLRIGKVTYVCGRKKCVQVLKPLMSRAVTVIVLGLEHGST
jgi:hypothetical protein